MKDLRKLSTEALLTEQENLKTKIEDYEKYLSTVRSQLVSLLYQSMIQKWKKEEREVKAELEHRDASK